MRSNRSLGRVGQLARGDLFVMLGSLDILLSQLLCLELGLVGGGINSGSFLQVFLRLV